MSSSQPSQESESYWSGVPVWPRSSFFSFFFPDGKHLASWVVAVKWTRPYFVCGPLVTSKFMRGWKSFDTALIKVDFRNFKDDKFFTSNVGNIWCREGGCEMCQVDKICINFVESTSIKLY